jgi:translation initiation factor IF-1
MPGLGLSGSARAEVRVTEEDKVAVRVGAKVNASVTSRKASAPAETADKAMVRGSGKAEVRVTEQDKAHAVVRGSDCREVRVTEEDKVEVVAVKSPPENSARKNLANNCCKRSRCLSGRTEPGG